MSTPVSSPNKTDRHDKTEMIIESGAKYHKHKLILYRGLCGCDCIVVGFTTTCAISAYHH